MNNMAVTIAHARHDEHNKIVGGSAGDQTGGEVAITNWYLHSKGWVVLRCKNATKREKIAQAAEKASKNNQIGYDQNQRDTLFNNVKDKGFDPSKTTKKVECDCSSLVRVCVAYAYGKDIAGNIRTVTEPNALVKTGEFTKYTDAKYCKSSDYLKRGDILCTPSSGHTVVVLKDGAKVKSSTSSTSASTSSKVKVTKKKATETAKSFNKSVAGTYKTTGNLNVRNGAGTKANAYGKDKTVFVTIPKGTEVKCYGYYTTVGVRKWLYVQFTYKNVEYTGFCSTKYLSKV